MRVKCPSCLLLTLVICTALLESKEIALAQRAPDHDLRIVVGTSLPAHELTHFYDAYYGDTIRLGEFGCGDPLFLVHLNDGPRLVVDHTYNPNGDYGATVSVNFGFNAKIYEQCLALGGCDHCSIGFDVHATTGPLTDLSSLSALPFRADVTTSLFGLPHPVFSMSNSVPLPMPLSSIPVELQNVPGAAFDFGNLVNGNWVSAGKHKAVPLKLRLGAIPQGDNTYLVLDGTVGNRFRFRDFPNNQDAVDFFQSDLPVGSGQNIGISVNPTFFGKAEPVGNAGNGFLSELLPIRILGEQQTRFLFWKVNVKYEVVLNGASVQFVKHEGKDAYQVDLTSTHVRIGKKLTRKALKSLSAHILFDRLHIEDRTLKFRVADFRMRLSFWKWLFIPVRLSSGALEESLHHGIPLGDVPDTVTVALPDSTWNPPCINTQYEKFKSTKGDCGDAGQRIGFLSFQRRGSARSKIFFFIYPQNFTDPVVVDNRMMFAGRITVPQ